jgi:hypothetical protein
MKKTKPKKTKIIIENYMQHWIESTLTGHVIKIVDGDDNTWNIACNWKRYRRTGRFFKE